MIRPSTQSSPATYNPQGREKLARTFYEQARRQGYSQRQILEIMSDVLGLCVEEISAKTEGPSPYRRFDD